MMCNHEFGFIAYLAFFSSRIRGGRSSSVSDEITSSLSTAPLPVAIRFVAMTALSSQ